MDINQKINTTIENCSFYTEIYLVKHTSLESQRCRSASAQNWYVQVTTESNLQLHRADRLNSRNSSQLLVNYQNNLTYTILY